MEPPTPQLVERARAELLAARETIDAGNDVLAAAWLSFETGRLAPAKHGDKHGGGKTASIMTGQSAKWFLYCEGKFRLYRITAQ